MTRCIVIAEMHSLVLRTCTGNNVLAGWIMGSWSWSVLGSSLAFTYVLHTSTLPVPNRVTGMAMRFRNC
jgi:hypothetical protein